MHKPKSISEFHGSDRAKRPASKSMKAAVYRAGKLKVEKIDKPKISEEQALLRVRCTGLCGTDVKKVHNDILGLDKDDARIFGHEIVGEIVDCGKEIDNLIVGERVAVFHHVPCMEEHCQPCQEGKYSQCPTYKGVDTSAGYGKPSGGGFAEYIVLPKEVIERGMIQIPAETDYEEAVFIEPLNCVLKALDIFEKYDSPIKINEDVLVFGQGANGLLFTQLLNKEYGANVVSIEKDDFRRGKSEEFGAEIFRPDETDKLRGRKIRKAIVACASEEAIRSAVELVGEGGIIVYFGDLMPQLKGGIDWNDISRNERVLTVNNRLIVPSYSSAYELHTKAAEMVFSQKLDLKSLITHTIGLDDLSAAVNGFVDAHMYYMGEEREEVLKILVEPNKSTVPSYHSRLYGWMRAAMLAACVTVLPMLGLAGLSQIGMDRKLKDNCETLTGPCNYVCKSDHGDLFQKWKVEKEGKVYYYDYVCFSPP